jgi:arylsulfatase A-like enzyme
MKQLLLVSASVLVFASVSAAPWRRHTIDASSSGADGARLMDVNGDGYQDIATGWEEGGVVRAYLHPGYMNVKGAWPAVTVGKVRKPEDAVFVDLDSDGSVDVVSACEGQTKTIYVHWAPKDRAKYLSPRAWTTEAIPVTAHREAWMFVLPLDVDGKDGIDLVVGSKGEGASISWLQAPANPRDLNSWKLHRLRSSGWIMSLQAHDMDGDGDLDVLASDRKGARRGVLWLENPAAAADGSAEPTGATAVVADGDGLAWTEHVIEDGHGEVMFLSAGDLDQDGLRDVVVAVRKGPLAYLRSEGGNGDAWDDFTIEMPARCGTGKGAAIGDINGDGRADLVFSCEAAVDGRSGVRWLSTTEPPTHTRWLDHEISGPEGIKFDRIELYDIDGDTDLDVITCEERDQLGVIWYENPLRGRRPPNPRRGRRPNVVLIVADDLGREALGAYGGTSYKTPHLDALAANGIRFTNCFSSARGTPSRLTLLTGRYSFRTTEEWDYLPPDEVTLGHAMSSAGYATALAGRWRYADFKTDPNHPARSGFAESTCWAAKEGSRYWKPAIYQNGQICHGVSTRYGPDVYCDFVIDFIQRQAAKPATPFFAYYSMTLPHSPQPDAPHGSKGRHENYGEMVEELDRQVGKIVAALKERGLDRRTLVLFTSDNGAPPSVTSHIGSREIRGGKGSLRDSGTRVPLIAGWPVVTPPGLISEDLVDLSDVFSTLVELRGRAVSGRKIIDGKSFAPQLRGLPGNVRRWVYTQADGRRWIRDRHWKLYGNGVLFDMESDPEEKKPLSAESEPPSGTAARKRLAPILSQLK